MDKPMKGQDDWEQGDIWLALLFLLMGALVLFFGYSLWLNGWHVLISGLCLTPGLFPFLLALPCGADSATLHQSHKGHLTC